MPTRSTMIKRFALAPLAAGVLALCSPISASAANLLRFYAGAAVGQADIRANEVAPLGFNEHATGWKILVGIRPISLIGAELEYVNFGHPSAQVPLQPQGVFNANIQADAHPRATILSGLLHAPLPVPLLDLYGKVGLSRLRTNVHASVVCSVNGINTACPPNFPFPAFDRDETTTEFAYGAGAQLKFSTVAARLEYERLNASGGNPDLLSIGVTWTF